MKFLADPATTAPLELAPEPPQVEAIADLIASHRLSRDAVDGLPDPLLPVPADILDPVILAINRRIPWPTAGWKVGAASTEVQKLERLLGPVPGRLYRDTVFPTGSTIPSEVFINHRNTECEFGFVLAEPLPAREQPYTQDEVDAALGPLVPTLEIGDTVFLDWYPASADFYGPCLDNGGGCAIVLGEPVEDWRSYDLTAATIDLYRNGDFVRQGLGVAAMGNPVTSITWLANWASRYGIGLRAGEILSSGTCTGHCFAQPGDEIRADFGPLGEVSARYA